MPKAIRDEVQFMPHKYTGIKTFIPVILILVISVCSRSAAFENTGNNAAQIDLFQAYPWLKDRIALSQEYDLSKSRPAMSSRGVYGVGNGRVFALVGVGLPQNTLTNLVGPVYEKSETVQFTPVWNRLIRNNAEITQKPVENIELPKCLLYRVRGAAIVVNRESNGGVSMYSVTYAPPGDETIYRIVTVRNETKEPVEGLSLVVESHTIEETAEVFAGSALSYKSGDRIMLIDLPGASAKAAPGKLEFPLGVLAPGGEAAAIVRISFFRDEVDRGKIESAPESFYPKLEETRAYWHNWLDGSLSARSSDKKLADLFENTLVMLKTQIVESNGALVVMARYSGAWCRDAYGPIRYLLWGGKYKDAGRIAAYYDYATRLTGFRNRYNADLDIKAAPEEFDWQMLDPLQGDDPNILILHIYNYYRFTGDRDFIREHYGFMRRNMLGQKYDNFMMPFHGDETFQVYVMMAESAAMRDFYSVDTNFWYTVAAEAMADMAGQIGEKEDAALFRKLAKQCRAVTDETYWREDSGFYIPYKRKDTLEPAQYPFANINLHPLWNGYGKPADRKQKKNLLKTVKTLMSKNGTINTTPRVSYYTGMTPGLLLYDLKKMGAYRVADRAFTAMTKVIMSPTGEFAEAYDGKDRWINYAANPNLYRPWETAIDVEALLYYILGMEYDHTENLLTLYPCLPPGVGWIEFSDLHAGPASIDIGIKKSDSGTIEVNIRNSGEGSVGVQVYMEADMGRDTPEGAVNFDTHAWARRLWLYKSNLAPGMEMKNISGTISR